MVADFVLFSFSGYAKWDKIGCYGFPCQSEKDDNIICILGLFFRQLDLLPLVLLVSLGPSKLTYFAWVFNENSMENYGKILLPIQELIFSQSEIRELIRGFQKTGS